MPGKIPNRWLEYQPFKQPVKDTRFIAFKCPLEQSICHGLPREKWLTPSQLIKQLENDGYKLGMVIDLTNTNRYYKPEDIQNQGLKYMKINTEGIVIPSKEVQERFVTAVDEFLESNADNDLLIGVHCTHGLNRTGYMVCRYMIDRMNIDPEAAITEFNEARGYNMERENYLNDLRNSNKEPKDRVQVDSASEGEIVEDEDSESEMDALAKPAAAVQLPLQPRPPLISEPPEPLLLVNQRATSQRGSFRGKLQNEFRGRGSARRVYGNHGYQNAYGRGGGFNQNFDNRKGHRLRNLGVGGGGFHRKEHGYQKPPFHELNDDDLDDDTEVIITETERGTIIREERSISEYRRKHTEMTRGPGAAYRNPGVKRRHEDDDYRPTKSARDRAAFGGFGHDWATEDRSGKKQWDSGFPDRDAFRTGTWRGRDSFEGEHFSKDAGRGRGRGSADPLEGRMGRGPPYREADEWDASFKGRGYRDNVPPSKHKYGMDSLEDNYPRKDVPGFGMNERPQRGWSPEETKMYHDPESRFRAPGQFERFRGRGDGYRGCGRGRDASPPLLEQEDGPMGYRSKARGANYGKEPSMGLYPGGDMAPGLKEPVGFSQFREGSPAEFFGKKSRPPFLDEGPSAAFGKKMSAAGFADESPGYGRMEGDGFRKDKYGIRGNREYPSEEGDGGLSAARRRRMTPPAQYRDPEPLGDEDSPPFCDSPPFTGSGEGFGAPNGIFAGCARDDGFRGRGRPFARKMF